jgi:hypothetical protein
MTCNHRWDCARQHRQYRSKTVTFYSARYALKI